MGRRRVVVAVVGYSGSGKTTLLEKLLPALAARGLSVGALKRASHGFEADQPGKDSHRLYAAGADAVALVSDAQLACFVRRPDASPVGLAEALAALPADLDLVLVEGFSWEPIPRIVVRGAERPAAEHLASGPLLEVVDLEPPAPGAPPAIPDALVASLADALARRARPAAAARGAA
jgi:molybdopterin-guanine dinucleotide biosynthesis protein B